MPVTPQMAAIMNVHLANIVRSEYAHQSLRSCAHFLPRLFWMGVNAWVPIAAPVFPMAADSP